MIFSNYTEASLLCNVSVNGETSEKGMFSYRGDMVIQEGDIADAQGRRHPPKAVIKQAVVLASSDKITTLVGAIDDIGFLPELVAKYGNDFSQDIRLLFYVANISRPLIVEVGGFTVTIIPHEGGAVWTLIMDDVRLEKSDFKEQSAEDKVITMVEGLNDFQPKYDQKSFNDALGFTVEVSREARGPV